MKILIVIDTLGSGGAQKLNVKLAKGLKKRTLFLLNVLPIWPETKLDMQVS